MKRKIFVSLSLLLFAMIQVAEGKQPAQTDTPVQKVHVQSQQENALIQGWFIGQSGKIREVIKAKAGGHDAYIVFYHLLGEYSTEPIVSGIYFIDHPKGSSDVDLPIVRELVYHDLGPEKEFCGIKILETIKNKKTGKLYLVKYENRLDDASAQKIIDLLAGDSKWINRTNIKFSETTDPSPAALKIVHEIE